MRRGALASLYDFTGHDARLCLLTFAGAVPVWPGHGGAARFAFRLEGTDDLSTGGLGDDGRSFTKTPGDQPA